MCYANFYSTEPILRTARCSEWQGQGKLGFWALAGPCCGRLRLLTKINWETLASTCTLLHTEAGTHTYRGGRNTPASHRSSQTRHHLAGWDSCSLVGYGVGADERAETPLPLARFGKLQMKAKKHVPSLPKALPTPPHSVLAEVRVS